MLKLHFVDKKNGKILPVFQEKYLNLLQLFSLYVYLSISQYRQPDSQRRAESWEVQTTFLGISGQWVGRESRHIKGVYLTLCLRRVESCKFIIVVSNMVNGRCPGCDYIHPVETLQAQIVSFWMQSNVYKGL